MRLPQMLIATHGSRVTPSYIGVEYAPSELFSPMATRESTFGVYDGVVIRAKHEQARPV